MDYPEEGEKSAFTLTEPSRARDFSRRISKAVDLLSPCSKNALFICATAYDVSSASYLSFSAMHNYPSIHIKYVTTKSTFNRVITKIRKDLSRRLMKQIDQFAMTISSALLIRDRKKRTVRCFAFACV